MQCNLSRNFTVGHRCMNLHFFAMLIWGRYWRDVRGYRVQAGCGWSKAGTESSPVSNAGWLDFVNNDDLLVAVHGGRQSHSQARTQRLGYFHQERTRSTGYGVCGKGGEERTNSKWTSGIEVIQIKGDNGLQSRNPSGSQQIAFYFHIYLAFCTFFVFGLFFVQQRCL